MEFEYKLSKEEYEALVDSECRNVTNEEYDAFVEDLKHHAMNGETLTESEMHIFYDEFYNDIVDEDYYEADRKGWIEYQEIVKLDERHFSFYRWYNDMCGTDFEPQTLDEVIAKEVKTTKWVLKNSN